MVKRTPTLSVCVCVYNKGYYVEILQAGERKSDRLQDKQGFKEFIFFTTTFAEILPYREFF